MCAQDDVRIITIESGHCILLLVKHYIISEIRKGMDKPRTFDRTISFDEELLRQLNEYALRKGQLLEHWLPVAIKEVLLPNLNKKPMEALIDYLEPGKDFDVPFSNKEFMIQNGFYRYPLGNPGLEEMSKQKTSRDTLAGNYNRLFPVVLCVRVVALYSQNSPMSKEKYYAKLREHAYQVRLSLIEKMQMHYRQRGPYDGLPAHRHESKTGTSQKELSSWRRFLRFFADVSTRPGSGGLAQRLNLITVNDEGDILLTHEGKTLADMKNPVLDDWNFDYDERIIKSTLSIQEIEFFTHAIALTHPIEYEKMCELVYLLKSGPMPRKEILNEFYILRHMSTPKKSAELNGLMGRMIDLQIIDRYAITNYQGDGRSSNLYALNPSPLTQAMVEQVTKSKP